jgi:hypothetical protein
VYDSFREPMHWNTCLDAGVCSAYIHPPSYYPRVAVFASKAILSFAKRQFSPTLSAQARNPIQIR